MADRWQSGDYSLDQWDAEQDRDSELDDYLNVDSRQSSAADAYYPGSGDPAVSRQAGDSNGEHWKNQDTTDIGVPATPPRTIITDFPEGGRVWRLQNDMPVTVWDDETGDFYTTPGSSSDARAELLLLDGLVDSLGLPRQSHKAVFRLVSSEVKLTQWQIHHQGWKGMAIGYASFVRNRHSLADAKRFATAVCDAVDMTEREARAAVEHAFDRAADRGLCEPAADGEKATA